MEKTIQWVLNNINEGKGIIVSDKNCMSYPEVSGYLIETLVDLGYREKALQIGNWLSKIQDTDGSIKLVNDKYLFDTVMVIKGWSKLVSIGYEQYQININRACEFIISQIDDNGIFNSQYHMKEVPKKILVWCLSVLLNEGYEIADIWDKWANDPAFYNFDCLSHFYCYTLDAVLNADPINKYAINAVHSLAKQQRSDGSIPAYKDVDWTCYTGVAQAAILFYKVELNENGNRAMKYLENIMNDDGSFYGSNGSYFPNEKISWASKFYLDAYQLMIKAHMEDMWDQFPDSVDDNDIRASYLKKAIGDAYGFHILDIGCGKGRFAKILDRQNNFIAGVDIVDKNIPISTFRGSATRIPYFSNKIDIAYSIEVFEHFPCLVENAIKEVVRVLKPDGKFILIDKNKDFKGGKEVWEAWFDITKMTSLLSMYFNQVSVSKLDNQFIGWCAEFPKK